MNWSNESVYLTLPSTCCACMILTGCCRQQWWFSPDSLAATDFHSAALLSAAHCSLSELPRQKIIITITVFSPAAQAGIWGSGSEAAEWHKRVRHRSGTESICIDSKTTVVDEFLMTESQHPTEMQILSRLIYSCGLRPLTWNKVTVL